MALYSSSLYQVVNGGQLIDSEPASEIKYLPSCHNSHPAVPEKAWKPILIACTCSEGSTVSSLTADGDQAGQVLGVSDPQPRHHTGCLPLQHGQAFQRPWEDGEPIVGLAALTPIDPQIARHPILTILCCVLLTIISSIGFINITPVTDRVKLWIPSGSVR